MILLYQHLWRRNCVPKGAKIDSRNNENSNTIVNITENQKLITQIENSNSYQTKDPLIFTRIIIPFEFWSTTNVSEGEISFSFFQILFEWFTHAWMLIKKYWRFCIWVHINLTNSRCPVKYRFYIF